MLIVHVYRADSVKGLAMPVPFELWNRDYVINFIQNAGYGLKPVGPIC
jgi:hypothetical protein